MKPCWEAFTVLDPADLVVSLTENDDEERSFGHGRAQFLTGELQGSQLR
jgi:hypothetical protein